MTKIEELERRILTLEKIILGDFKPTKPLQPVISECLKTIAKITNQSVSDILSNSRKRVLVDARSIVMFYLKYNTRMSLSDIGQVFNGKNHATVRHSILNHYDLIDADKNYQRKWKDFHETISKNKF